MNVLKQYGMKRFIQFAVSELFARFWKRPILRIYGQSAEDVVLERLLKHKKHGFFTDVGAYDPYRFSNTMRFYQNGWRGINIEPSVANWRKFQTTRERDINLNVGIADKKGTLTYFEMKPPTLSTFSNKQAEEYQKQGFQIAGTYRVPVLPLSTVFRRYLKSSIDFLSVDVEGFELSVLQSNDWTRYRPSFMCIEVSHSDSDVLRYVDRQGYKLRYRAPGNNIYADKKKSHDIEGLISIIIVNWNGVKWLPDCFHSLSKQSYKKFEIIFVDNASSDTSVDWVKRHYPKTIIVKNKTNLGFAGANNVGFQHAKGEFILFLNNDTRSAPTYLNELKKAIEMDPLIAGVQSKILLMDQPDTYDSVGAYLTPTGFLYHFGFAKKQNSKYEKPFDLYTAKGASMMFRKSALDDIAIHGQIFDSDYFAYFEESDMCHRIWLSGYTIMYAPEAVLFHKMGATSSGMDNAFIQFHSFKNRIRTYLKNFGFWWLVGFFPFHIVLCELFSAVCLFRGKYKLALAIQRAIVWNIVHIQDTIELRKVVQRSMRLVSDGDLRRSIMRFPSFSYYTYLFTGSLLNYEEA